MDKPGWTLTAPGPSPAPGSIARQESVIEEKPDKSFKDEERKLKVMSMVEAHKRAQQGAIPSSPATSTPPAPSPENQQYHPLAAANVYQSTAPGYPPVPYQPQQPQMSPPVYPPHQHYPTPPTTQYPYQYGAPQYSAPPQAQPYPTPALPQNPSQPYPPQPSYQPGPQQPQQAQYPQYPPQGYAPPPTYPQSPQAPPAGYGYPQPAVPYGYPVQQQR